jgi:hypothetical protein
VNEGTDETAKIYVGGEPWWLRKMGDTTHFHMANSEKGIKAGGTVFHIGQHRDELYYNDLERWLKGGKINGKKYKGFFRQLSKENVNEEVSQQAKDDVITLLKSYDGQEVPDGKVHDIADRHGISPHDLESYIYSLASAHVTMKESIIEGRRGEYQRYRDDSTFTAQQKIGESIKRMRNSLKELNREVNLNLRLKTESGIESESYWKRTKTDLYKISEHIHKLLEKIRRF